MLSQNFYLLITILYDKFPIIVQYIKQQAMFLFLWLPKSYTVFEPT
jgi:hypothetical protein